MSGKIKYTTASAVFSPKHPSSLNGPDCNSAEQTDVLFVLLHTDMCDPFHSLVPALGHSVLTET